MKILANAKRDGNWWIAFFEIEGREFGTQAKSLTGLTPMVEDIAAMMGIGHPDVEIVVDEPGSVADYKVAAAAAAQANLALGRAARLAVRELSESGITVRDIAYQMEISPGRVSQLLAS